MEAIEKASKDRGEELNLAYLTDGLKAEREQGITIDVAYRYFSTPNRKYIIADSPGHVQYTRNMVTGASNAQVALILIDARKGMIEQTKRHLVISTLLQIPHIVVCINKMDLINWGKDRYNEIVEEVKTFSAKLNTTDLSFIPISALKGDNVKNQSENMDWYNGTTLYYYLENVFVEGDENLIDARFPVQKVLRVNNEKVRDFRGFAGLMESGSFKVGEDVVILPSGFETKISNLSQYGKSIEVAKTGESIIVQLRDEIDISRGDMIVRKNNQPKVTQEIDAIICWFDFPAEMNVRKKYLLKHTTNESRCLITEILYELNTNDLHRVEEKESLRMNEIGRVRLKTMTPLMIDSYSRNRFTGSFILVDESSNNTVAAGMII